MSGELDRFGGMIVQEKLHGRVEAIRTRDATIKACTLRTNRREDINPFAFMFHVIVIGKRIELHAAKLFDRVALLNLIVKFRPDKESKYRNQQKKRSQPISKQPSKPGTSFS